MKNRLPFLFQRREIKFRIDDPAIAERLRESVSANLPAYAYKRGYPETYVTTVYFDTQDLFFYHRARRKPDNNVKVRLKEYYYPKDGNGEFLWSPHCWIEIKRRRREVIFKNRFCVSKELVPAFLVGEDLFEDVLALNVEVPADDLRQVYGRIRRLFQSFPISARAIVSYRRRTYQRQETDLRITFDDEIAFYGVPRELYNGCPALTRYALGAPQKQERYVIVEIKDPGQIPMWLESALCDLPSINYSKFLTSTREIYDSGEKGDDSRDRDGDERDDSGTAVS
ncbi:MAG: VTC domain-containing protein [Planctomycetes bacterium]|nr:VTC domain-containing protein [Planctomycetota bacterium]